MMLMTDTDLPSSEIPLKDENNVVDDQGAYCSNNNIHKTIRIVLYMLQGGKESEVSKL